MAILKCLFLFIIHFLIKIHCESGDSVELKCEEIRKISFYEAYNGTLCTINNVSGDSGSTFLIRTSNYYEYNVKIQEVEFQNCKLYDVPRQLFQAFRNLVSLKVNQCQIGDLSRYIFDYAHTLEELTLQGNKLTKIPSMVFASASNLKIIDLSQNQIAEVEGNSFNKLGAVEELYLNENKINTLPDNIFSNLINLAKLKLDTNKIQLIEDNLFSGNLNLTEITLNNNEIIKISPKSFDKLEKLKILNLSFNRLTKLDVSSTNLEKLLMMFNKVTHVYINRYLKTLFASYNELESVELNGNQALLDLKLRGNKLVDLVNITTLKNLEILDLSFNNISRLNISTFATLTQLRKLNLEFTDISTESLNYGTFTHFSELTHLDISYNSLKEINFHVFASLQLLSHLKIDGNNLTELQSYETIKQIFPKLILISLGDNDWNCTYLMKMVRELKQQNIIVYVFSLTRAVNVPNVEGIACHNNNTKHVYWKKAVVHADGDDAREDLVAESSTEETDLKKDVAALNASIFNLKSVFTAFQLSFDETKSTVNKLLRSVLEKKSSEKIVPAQAISLEGNGFIKFVFSLMCVVGFIYFSIKVAVFARGNFPRKPFYPSGDVYLKRHSTTTIQTNMEQDM